MNNDMYSETRKEGLLPCPFCGAEGAKFEATVGVISRVGSYAAKECQHMVVCQSCKATGPCKGTISRAVIAWNYALREEKLLPCPICGRDADTAVSGVSYTNFGEPANHAHCKDNSCLHGPDADTEQEAIAAWNKIAKAYTAMWGEPLQFGGK